MKTIIVTVMMGPLYLMSSIISSSVFVESFTTLSPIRMGRSLSARNIIINSQKQHQQQHPSSTYGHLHELFDRFHNNNNNHHIHHDISSSLLKSSSSSSSSPSHETTTTKTRRLFHFLRLTIIKTRLYHIIRQSSKTAISSLAMMTLLLLSPIMTTTTTTTTPSIALLRPSSAHAVTSSRLMASAASSTSTSSSSSSSSDHIITRYIEKHMFDDEKYDAFESTYREAHSDSLSGYNPIRDTLASLHSSDDASSTTNNNAASANSNVINTILSTINPLRLLSRIYNVVINAISKFAEVSLGMDPKTVRVGVAVVTFMVMPPLLGYGLLSFGGLFRKLLQGQETRRYGGVTDLQAIEKEEEIVEADEDDDDDDDDDNDEDGN